MAARQPGIADYASELPELARPAKPTAGNGRPSVAQRLRSWLPPAALAVVLLVTWQWAARAGIVSHLVMPAPSDIGGAFVSLFVSGLIWEHLFVTLSEALLGFAIGGGLAFLLAVLSSFWGIFRQIVSPYMVGLQVTPRVALAPIFITWFGFGMTPKVVMAATICFFPVFINTLTGLLNSDQEAMEMFRSMRASRLQIFTQLTLPSAMPVTLAGLKTGLTLALIGAIVAEFIATDVGLGMLMDRFNFRLAMESAFAVLLVLALLGLAMYAVMEWLDRRIVFWTDVDRLAKKRTKKLPTT